MPLYLCTLALVFVYLCTFVFLCTVSLYFCLISIVLTIHLHASKHINFSITYQPKPYQRKITFLLIRILSEVDFVLSSFLCQNVQTMVGGGGLQILGVWDNVQSFLNRVFWTQNFFLTKFFF